VWRSHARGLNSFGAGGRATYPAPVCKSISFISLSLFHYREIWKWPKLMSMQAAGNDNNTTRQNSLSGYFLNRDNTSHQAV
jgi:hypothetical protein